MLNLLLAVIFGLVFAVFATQNTGNVIVKFLPFDFLSLPIYALVILSIIVGLLIGWLFTLTQAVSSAFALRRKDNTITSVQKDRTNLEKRIRDLEDENAKLRNKNVVETIEAPRRSALSFR